MTTTRVPAPDLIMAALTQATTPVTVTELAEEAGVGRSTVSKYLPTLEKNGAALRTPGGREGRRRLPDQWQAAPTTSPEQESSAPDDLEDPDTVPATTVEVTVCEQQVSSTSVDIGETQTQDPIEKPAPETECPNTGQVPAPAPGPRLADTAPVPVPTSSAPAPRTSTTPVRDPAPTGTDEQALNPISRSRRLAPGELKTMVWALLKNSPGEEFTATALSHILQGRSIGAIQNNLAKLAEENKIELACAKPRRYRFATSAN
ncbi:HTH domain-containing protein [Nocardiopsis sp. JB363]|uniref:HTH domain-containing protein n=1 Tax=Nocardiopsis sp. JB363 TaxID=1434837 RepID=UPI00097AF7E1|nr:HTH domain-containing protein [Nocardiopsis sp. JB363]SIO89582.1 hypothetical protein BQ8420_22320 [Nocardiopsis sp. JB363]